MNQKHPKFIPVSVYLAISGLIVTALVLLLPFERLTQGNHAGEIFSQGIISSVAGQITDSDQQLVFLPLIIHQSDSLSGPGGNPQTPTPTLEPSPSPTPANTSTSTPVPTLEPLPTETLTPSSTPSPTPTVNPAINLALGKPSTQSSVAYGGFALYANDGNINGNFGSGSVSQTRLETEPWWQVSLVQSPLKLETVELFSVGDTWQTASLQQSYSSMVAVCSQVYQSNSVPTVIRMRNAGESSFDIKLQNPTGEVIIQPDPVICLVMEEGDYYLPDGTLIEAQKYESTITSNSGKWEGERQNLAHQFTNPILFGQVMTTNDERWSTFWSRGSSRTTPPSADSLFTGKHVGQDLDIERSPETIGFIVVEAGSGSINNSTFQTGLSERSIIGIENNSSPVDVAFAIPFNSAPRGAIVSQAGMSGVDGSWSYVMAPPFADRLTLSVDEDQLQDDERRHVAEHVGYFVYSSPIQFGPRVDTEEDNIGSLFDISEVVLYNRSDCCADNLSNVNLFVSSKNMAGMSIEDLTTDSDVWSTTLSGPLGPVTTVPVGQLGSHVKIQLDGDANILALAEVQVLGSPLTGGQALLQVGQVSTGSTAVESTGNQVVYQVNRLGGDAAQAYPFQVLGGSGTRSTNPNFARMVQDQGLTLSSQVMANSSDFVIKDGDGNILTNTLPFAEGQTEAQLVIEAVADDNVEVPELLLIQFVENGDVQVLYTNEINVTLTDNPPGITDDSKLFVGLFAPENGAGTTAYGFATVRLSGDNRYGIVNVSFSGLTSEQTAAHIHISNPGGAGGPVAFSLPLGQVEDVQWGIKGAHFLTTDQAMLEGLMAGNLYVNVHSTNYPAGEIRADLTERTGSPGEDDPDFNYPPPAYEVLTGEALEQDIYRFLSQATFGPTPESVANLKARIDANGGDRIAAYNAWIDEQLLLQSPSHSDYYYASRLSYAGESTDVDEAIRNGNSRDEAMLGGWLVAALYADAELRERTAFALSEILVVGGNGNNMQAARADYSNTLKVNAFGNYEDLLYAVSRHPAMGVWLSHFRNQKSVFDNDGNVIASPDENYAREIMQLFSIGLLELHPDGTLRLGSDGLPIETYTQDDISELARVFTGWGAGQYAQSRPDGRFQPPVVAENNNFNRNLGNSNTQIYLPEQTNPMKNFDAFHDTERKEVLGYVFPAGQNGETELNQIVDVLASHPNTAPFIAYRMIQRMTTSNPSPGYIYRVSTAFTNSNGNMGEMVRAILLDPEARNLSGMDTIGVGRIREPLVQFVTLCRVLNCASNQSETFPLSDLVNYGLSNQELNRYGADASRVFLNVNTLNGGANSIQQLPFGSPTVFNWFLPDYAPPGPVAQSGLVAPEMQHMTEAIVVNYYNLMYGVIFNPNGIRGYRPRVGEANSRLASTTPQELVDAYMAVMDSNGNGRIQPSDAAFNDPAKIREATEAIVDIADNYLCGGWLQAEATGDLATDPREVIVTGVINALSDLDDTTAANALTARNARIQETLLAMTIAPQCNVQR